MDPKNHQTIPIKPIEKQETLYATFSKRRKGLFNKASKYCTNFGADIGLVLFTPTNIPHSFFSPTMESVIERYQNPNSQPSIYQQVDYIHAHESIKMVNQKHCELRAQLAAELERENRLKEEEKKARAEGRYKDFNVEEMDKEKLAEMKALFERVRAETATRMEKLQSGEGSSSVDEN